MHTVHRIDAVAFRLRTVISLELNPWFLREGETLILRCYILFALTCRYGSQAEHCCCWMLSGRSTSLLRQRYTACCSCPSLCSKGLHLHVNLEEVRRQTSLWHTQPQKSSSLLDFVSSLPSVFWIPLVLFPSLPTSLRSTNEGLLQNLCWTLQWTTSIDGMWLISHVV